MKPFSARVIFPSANGSLNALLRANATGDSSPPGRTSFPALGGMRLHAGTDGFVRGGWKTPGGARQARLMFRRANTPAGAWAR